LSADVTLVVSGKVDIGKGVTISSGTYQFTIDSTGDIKIGKNSSITANLISNKKVELNDNVTFNGNISANGEVKIGDNGNFIGNITGNNKVEIKKGVNFTGNISGSGEVKLKDNVTFTGDITAGGKIDIGKSASFVGEINANGNIKIKTGGSFLGNITSGNKLDIQGSTSVTGICTPAHPKCTPPTTMPPTVNVLTTLDTTPILTGTFDSANSATFTVRVNSVDYVLSSSSELTNTGDDWALDLSLITPLTIGIYDVLATSDDGAGNIASDSTTNELTIFGPIGEWRFDASSWSGGGALEVLDSSGYGRHGTAVNGVSTANTTPAIGGNPGTCRYGMFDGINDYIGLAGIPELTGSFSITAWIYANEIGNDQRIFVDDENNTNGFAFSLGDGGNGRLRFFSRSVNPVVVDTQSAVITAGQWYHVVAVHNAASKTRQIFVNGTAVLLSTGGISSTYSGTWGFDNGAASIGGETNNAGSEAVPRWRFNGNIDEVRVYNMALDATQINVIKNETRPCPSSGPDHYQITHSSQGITCEAEPITITAHDAGNTAVAPSSSTTITLSTSLANDGWSLQTGGGNGTFIPPNQYTFNGVETSATFLLRKAIAASGINIDVTDGSATDLNGNLLEDQAIDFVDAGFRFYAGGTHDTIGTQIAGKSSGIAPGAQTLTLRSVRTNSNTKACEAAIIGPQTVQMGFECVNPTTCKSSNGVTIIDSVIGGSGNTLADNPQGNPISNYSPVNLTFNASGEAMWTMNYLDAGQIRLHASYLIPANGSIPAIGLSGSSNPVASVPAGLCVSSPDTNAACSIPYASCDPAFRQAGVAFNLNIKGVVWQSNAEANTDFCDNNTTPNFQLNGIDIAQDNVAPADVDGGVAGVAGVTSFDLVASDNGDHNISNQTSSEVGVFSYTATPTNLYFGESISASTSAPIGRFTPSAFDIINVMNGAFDNVCKSTANMFTYIGQDFSYVTNPAFTVRALNGLSTPLSPQIAVNYRGDFVKLSATSIVFADISQDSLNTGTDGNPLLVSYTRATLPIPTKNNGTVDYVFGNDNFRYGVDDPLLAHVKFANSEVVPFVADIDPKITRVNDGDVETSFSQTFNTAGNNQRFGRIRMSNAFGSELLNLNIPMKVEYFTGSFYQTNADDSCTTFDSADLIVVADNLSIPGSSTIPSTTPTALAGELSVSLTAPGNGITGSIDLRGFLAGPLTGVINNKWLRYNWDNGTEFNDDPGATATFGIYKGNDVNIYIQQIYRP